ncbi:hypothetical protein WR25_12579 [Diploscapter pachys]|uniref:C6 domain-containing protein n=1 Tax=Diploscapter pachys TaxID=2018661 RepID=A0A2A2L7N1_9BILA|nr:hypothetical protein WR25_12579 [Diploscapter pachys]
MFPWLTSIPVNFAPLSPNANGCVRARLTCTSPVNDYIGTNMPVDNTITFDVQCNSNGEWVAVQDTNIVIHSAECYYEE